MIKLAATVAATLAVATAASAAPAAAPAAASNAAVRTMFEQVDAQPNQEVHFGSAKFPANGVSAPHTHPGVEMLVILEGEVEFRINGQPRTLRKGDHLQVARDVPHSAIAGASGATMSNVWVVDKGRPLATPITAPAN